MSSSNKLSRKAKRDKYQRFSIRKFNVGVASVAIAAFWMVSGTAAAAENLDVTPETAGDASALVVETAEGEVEADEVPASPEAEVAEVAEEAPAEEVAEVAVEEAEVAEEAPAAEETVEAEVAEAEETAKAEEVVEEAPKAKAVAVTPNVAAETVVVEEAAAVEEVAETPVVRVAKTTYSVQYVNEETGVVEYQRNYPAKEETTASAEEAHTFNVSVDLDVPAGFVAVSASNVAGQELAIVNNAIAAAIVEKDSSSSKLIVTVRQDDVTANNNSEENSILYSATETERVLEEEGTSVKTDGVDISIKKKWTDEVAPTKESRESAEAEALTEYVYPDLSTVTNEGGQTWDATGITISPDKSLYTFGILYLGDPFDGGEETDTLHYTNDDYNERNGHEYYITASLPKDGSSTDVTLQLMERGNDTPVETLVVSKGQEDAHFETLTAAVSEDDYKLNYKVDYKVDGRVSTLSVKPYFTEDLTNTVGAQTLYGPKGSEAVGTNNRNLTVYNMLAPARQGNSSNGIAFQVPIPTTQNTYYKLVDAEQYQTYLTSGQTYLSQKTGTEELLTTLENTAYDGSYFNIGGKLDFDKYEFVEGPEANEDEVSGVLTAKYSTGERILQATSQNHRRVFVFDKEDGTGHFEVWLLDPTKEGHEAYYGDTTTADRETLEKYYRLIFETGPVEPGGNWNDTKYAYDFKDMHQNDDYNMNATATAATSADAVNRNEHYSSQWGGTVADSSGAHENGSYFLPIIQSSKGTAETGRIGYLRSNLRNDYESNTQDAEYFYVEKGSVTTHYVDVDGTVLQDSILDTDHGDSKTAYDTSDSTNDSENVNTKPEELVYNGETYYLVADDSTTMTDGSAIKNGVKQDNLDADEYKDNLLHTSITDEQGEVEAGKHKHLTYVYQKGGDVVVRYYAVDENGDVVEAIEGTATGIDAETVAAEEEDTATTKPGTSYDTKDLRPDTITTADGKVYQRVDIDGTNPHDYTDGKLADTDDADKVISGEETGEVTSAKTTLINYYYEELKGNVEVRYYAVDKDGNVIEAIADAVIDTPTSSNGTEYDTSDDNKPTYITAPNGKVYQLVSVAGTNPHAYTDGELAETDDPDKVISGEETGTVTAAKTTLINYYYEEVPANVNVHYFIVDENGEIVDTLAGDATGIDKETVEADEKDTEAADQGTDYDTTDLRPDTITTADGTLYQRVDIDGTNPRAYTAGDAESGATEVVVEEDGVVDDTKDVNYYYEAVKTNVNVHYYGVDADGNVLDIVLADDVEDTKDAAQGTDYDTAVDYRPNTITDADGNVWQLVSINGTNPHAYTDGDAETGVTEAFIDEEGKVDNTKDVNYYYEKVPANVNVHYFIVDENGEVVDTLAGEAKGIDKDAVEADEVDTEAADQGTDYDTKDLRPDYIKADGVTYKRVDLNGTNPHAYTDGDDETGQATVVVDEDGNIDDTKDVNYYYEKVTGDVEVHYHIVDAAGNVLVADAIKKRDVATDENIDEPYETISERDPYIVVDGKVYTLVTEETSAHPYTDGDAEEGAVVDQDGPQVVNYYYVEVPTYVNVHYYAVDAEGNVLDIDLKDSVVDTDGAAQATDYDTTDEDMKPDTIVKDGVTYKRVDINGTNLHAATDGDDETGVTEVTVDEDGTLDDTKDVNYYYERISGDVEVRYHIVDKDGNVLVENAIEKRDVSTDEEIDVAYNTESEKDPYITVDGKVYALVTEETSAHPYTDGDEEDGQVAEGLKTINYYYVEVPTNVNVHYYAVDKDGKVIVDEDGEPVKLQASAEDTVDAPQETAYNTAEDLKPAIIIDANGDVWQLVSAKGTNPHAETDGDAEKGATEVVVNEDGSFDNTKDVNYYYEKVTANVNVHYHVVDEAGNVVEELGGIVSGIDKYKVDTTEEDTKDGEQGDDYDTTDLRPDTIVKDGVTYKRVDINGTNPKEYTDGDDETGKVEVIVNEDGTLDDTKDVHYYYERISGDVEVHYHIVNAAGEILTKDAVALVVDEKDKDIATLYNTEDQKAPYIVVDGKIYDLVTEETSERPYTDGDDETGKVAEGTKVVNYYYIERPTNVNVHYYAVDEDGNVIEFEDGSKLADSQTVKDGVAQGEDYDTTGEDTKPDTIKKDGVTYKRVDLNGTNPHAATDGDDETGVTEAVVTEDGDIDDTKDVNYYYERISGNVNVHYYAVDENGNVVEFADGDPLKASVVDTEDENIDEPYDTTDNRPDFIVRDAVDETTGETETRLYKRVDLNGTNPHAYTDGDAEDGAVEEGTKDVNYYYEHIIGNVHVRYYAVDENGDVVVFEDGSKLADDVLDTVEGEIGEDYDTTEHKPDTIVKDGVTYKRVDLPREDGKVNPHAATDGDPEVADVTEKDREVNYYYEKVTGDVIVHYVDTEGNVIAEEVVDTEKANIGEEYNTDEDNKPATITTEDGTVYYLTAQETEDEVDGKVVEGTTHVTYIYEKGGDVVVNYIGVDKDGNVLDIIATQERDTEEFTKPGTAYDTTDLKPSIIVDAEGNTWRLVSLAGTNPHAETDGADEAGEVKAGETLEVNYYYELVTGDVVVSYVDEDGNQIAKNAVDTPKETPTGKAYNTDEDLKPESITAADGTVYYLTEKATSDRSANPIGSVVEGTTYVEYVYAKAGSVVVNYYPVDAEGNVIEGIELQAQVEDTKDAKAGTDYDTTDNKPTEITDAEGRTWRLVSVAGTNPHAETDGDDETGAVESGETKAINYYYELVTGDVVVHYVDTEGNVIAEDAIDTEEGTATGTAYNTDEDLKPESITTADGTVYYLTAKETSEDSAPTTGDVVEGTTEITYVYEKAGHVEVHYHIVDENGNVITADAIDSVKDTENGKPGSEFDTTDFKPAEITVDGVTYVLVADLTKDAETGSVVAGETQVVNYYYVVKPEAPTEEPTEVPTETPTEEPTEVPTETPTEEPTEVPTETPTEAPTEAPAPVAPSTPLEVGDELSEEDQAQVLETVEVPEGSTAKVTSPVKVDEDGAYVEVTITDETGETTVVKVPVDAITVLAPPAETAKPVVVGEELSEEDSETIIGRVHVPAGSTAEVTSPVKLNEDGVAVVEVTITDANGNTKVVEVAVDAVVTPAKEVAPTTPVLVGDTLTEENATAVLESITLPEGSTAEVTSPVKVDEEGNAYVEVTITDKAGNTVVVNVPVETAKAPTTVWVTEDGQVLHAREDGTLDISAFDGYEFVGTEVDADGNTTHIFRASGAAQQQTPTTIWITEDGQVLRAREDGSLEQSAFEGYEFVRTEVDEEGNITHIFRPVTKAPTTVWVTVDGQVLRPSEDGSLDISAFEGYEYVGTEVDEEGNITHIFRASGAAQLQAPTTIWITEDGQVLRAREDGSLEQSAFEGYEFVRTEVDEEGNITHIFRPVVKTGDKAKEAKSATKATATAPARSAQATSPQYVTKETAQLPNTGEESNAAALTGFGMFLAAIGLAGKRRRKED